MDSMAKNTSVGWLIAAIGCSSLALFFAAGLHPRWWLMWFMPIPVLLVAARSSGPRAFFVALVAWFLGSLNMWGVFRNVLQVPLVPVLAFLILPGCFFGLDVLCGANRHMANQLLSDVVRCDVGSTLLRIWQQPRRRRASGGCCDFSFCGNRLWGMAFARTAKS